MLVGLSVSAGASDGRVRVHIRSADDHSEVQHVGRGIACATDVPDDLTLGYGLTAAQAAWIPRQVGVVVGDAISSIDIDLATTERVPVHPNRTTHHRHDGGPV
jgi:hypothetical protein